MLIKRQDLFKILQKNILNFCTVINLNVNWINIQS